MARARNIKPGLFKNEVLGVLDPYIGLLFIGLWTLADKRGILEDRPQRIKAELFPYREGLDINTYLTALEDEGFIHRYEHNGIKLIQIDKFTTHQNPHHTEKDSIYPEYSMICKQPVKQPLTNGYAPADSLNTDSLITDSLITDIALADPGKPTKSGTRLPKEWGLPEEWKDWALENSTLSELQIRVECEKFKDHWHANANQRNSKKSDWSAAWRNWVRNVKPNRYQTKNIYVKSRNEQAIQDFVGNQDYIDGEVSHDEQ